MIEADGDNAIVIIPRVNTAVDAGFVRRHRRLVENADVLSVQLEIPLDASLEAARIARNAGRGVVVNAAPVVAGCEPLLALATVLVVNEVEAAALGGGAGSVEASARGLAARWPEAATVVSLGADGALIADTGGLVRVRAPAVTAVETVGAADALCGYLAAGIAAGDDLGSAVRTAVVAASASVTRVGGAFSVPHRHELEEHP